MPLDIVKSKDKKFRLKSFLIEGVEKSGKTSFLATLPKPILIFDAERSSESRLAGVEGIDFIECYDKQGEQPGAGYRRFIKNFNQLMDMKEIPYKSVCLDPLSFISDGIVQHLDRANPGLKGSSNTFLFWGKNKDAHVEIIEKLLSLPCIIGITSHVRLMEDETTGKKNFLPDINGSFRDSVGGKTDGVFFTKVTRQGTKALYQVQWVPDGMRKCGLRIPFGLENKLSGDLPPDYQKIMEMLNGKVAVKA